MVRTLVNRIGSLVPESSETGNQSNRNTPSSSGGISNDRNGLGGITTEKRRDLLPQISEIIGHVVTQESNRSSEDDGPSIHTGTTSRYSVANENGVDVSAIDSAVDSAIESINSSLNSINDALELNAPYVARSEDLNQLQSMGFTESESRRALETTRGDISRAIDELL